MKKSITAFLACGLFFAAGYTLVVAEDAAPAGEGAAIVAPRQYALLAQLLADSKADINKAVEITSKAVSEVVAKGQTYNEKQQLLSEIAASLMAAVKDWDPASRAAVAKAIMEEALKIAPDEPAARVGLAKFAAATIALVADPADTAAAIAAVPADISDVVKQAAANPTATLGGAQAWKAKDLYGAVRQSLGDQETEPEGGVSSKVAVSTTTSTTTTTTTTTTTIFGSGVAAGDDGTGPTPVPVPPAPTPPPVVPTTKPSPTPVGMR